MELIQFIIYDKQILVKLSIFDAFGNNFINSHSYKTPQMPEKTAM